MNEPKKRGRPRIEINQKYFWAFRISSFFPYFEEVLLLTVALVHTCTNDPKSFYSILK